MTTEFGELIGKGHPLRALLHLWAQGPQRFSGIERALDVNPTQLDRALKWLHERLYVLPRTVPSTGRIAVAYELSKRGHSLLEAFDSFVKKADENRDAPGAKSVDELHALAG